MKACPSCSYVADDAARICPSCGNSLSEGGTHTPTQAPPEVSTGPAALKIGGYDLVQIWQVSRWLFGILFAVLVLGNVLSAPLASFFASILTILLIPPLWSVVSGKWPSFNLSVQSRVILGIVALVAFGWTSPSPSPNPPAALSQPAHPPHATGSEQRSQPINPPKPAVREQKAEPQPQAACPPGYPRLCGGDICCPSDSRCSSYPKWHCEPLAPSCPNGTMECFGTGLCCPIGTTRCCPQGCCELP